MPAESSTSSNTFLKNSVLLSAKHLVPFPVFLLAFGTAIFHALTDGTFHQLALLATSPTFHNFLQLFFLRQHVGKLGTHHNVLVDEPFVLFAQIMSQTFQTPIHVLRHEAASIRVAHSMRFRDDNLFRRRIRQSFFQIREIFLRCLNR